jgi:hypothetical protein
MLRLALEASNGFSSSRGRDGRTPENDPKPMVSGPGKILRFEDYVCVNPGRFWEIFARMYVQNPGNFTWWTRYGSESG